MRSDVVDIASALVLLVSGVSDYGERFESVPAFLEDQWTDLGCHLY